MSYKLYKHNVDLFRGSGGATAYLVVASAALVQAYRQGANTGEIKDLGSTTGDLAVDDTGGIRVGDTIQLGVDTGSTATVNTIGDGTLNISAGITFDVTAVGQRLVVLTDPPKIYTDIRGQLAYSGTPGECPPISAATGNSEYYSTLMVMDLIVSGGGLSANQVLADQHGSMRWNFVTLEEFGGSETSVVPTAVNNVTALSAAVNYALKTGKRTVELGPGVYVTGTSQVLSNVTSGLRFIGHGPQATTVQFTNASGPLFDLTGTTVDVQFQDLTFERSAGSSTLIYVQSGVARTVFDRIGVNNGGSGIRDEGDDTVLADVSVTGTATNVLAVEGSGGRYRGLRTKLTGNCTNQIQVNASAVNAEFTGVSLDFSTSNLGGVGISVQGGDNVKFIGGSVTGGRGTTKADGVDVTGGTSIKFIGTVVRDSLIGFNLTGGSDVLLGGCTTTRIQQHGTAVLGTGNTRIQAHSSFDVSKQVPNTYDHVNVLGTASNAFVNGITVGGGTVRAGVYVEDGAGTNIRVLDVQGTVGTLAVGMYFNNKISSRVGVSGSHNGPHIITESEDHAGVGYTTRAFTAAETTLNVQDASSILINNAGAIAVAAMTGFRGGQQVLVCNIGAGAVTYADGAAFRNLGGASVVLATNESVVYMRHPQTAIWLQMAAKNA